MLMSVRPPFTESSTLRTVVIIPPSGPNALTASSVEWFSEMALHVICESEIVVGEKKNELDHEAKLSICGLFDLFHGPLLVMIVDHDVRTQALDILMVRRTGSSDHCVARKVQYLNSIGTNGAGTAPHKYRYFTIRRKWERASSGRDGHLQVAEDGPDSGAKGEWNRRCFFIP
jgi:hypothetical protein